MLCSCMCVFVNVFNVGDELLLFVGGYMVLLVVITPHPSSMNYSFDAIWPIKFPVNFSIFFKSGIFSALYWMHWNRKQGISLTMLCCAFACFLPWRCRSISAICDPCCEHISLCSDKCLDWPCTYFRQRFQSLPNFLRKPWLLWNIFKCGWEMNTTIEGFAKVKLNQRTGIFCRRVA